MANMVPEWTTADLWRRLADGRLLEPQVLDRQRERLASIDDVREALKQLLAAGELTTWQANQLLAGREDFAIGNYLLVDQVGQDDTGKHFLARHAQLGRNVLLKIVHRHLSKNDKVIQRFLQDAREAGALEHPNILHVFDVDQDRGRCFMVSEYCAGESLQSLVERQEPLPMDAVVSYIMQAAEALRYAHDLGVSHQHLHASHLLLSQRVIKIADFGVGELAASLAPENETAEQDHRQAVRLHAAQDVAALGRILVFLLDAAEASSAAVPSQTMRKLAGEMLKEPWTERITAESVNTACRRWLDEHHASQTVAPAPDDALPAEDRHPHWPGAEGAKPAPPRKPAARLAATEFPAAPSRSAIGRRSQSRSAMWLLAPVVIALGAAIWLAFRPPGQTTSPPAVPDAGRRGDRRDDPLSGVGGRATAAPRRKPRPTDEQGERDAAEVVEPAEKTPAGEAARADDADAAIALAATEPSEAATEPAMVAAASSDNADAAKPKESKEPKPGLDEGLAKKSDDPQPAPAVSPAFTGWAASVTLPALAAGSLALGDAPVGKWTVDLLGTATATRGGLPLTLKQDGPRWRVVDAEQREAAEIVLQDKQLHWRWLDAAADIPAAEQLANCVLRFRSGDRQHLLALREPLLIEPLSLKFENRNLIAESHFALPNRPAINAVQWRVLGVTGGNAKPQLAEDAKPLRLGRDESLVMVGNEQIPELFRLGFSTRWGRDVEIVAQVHAPQGVTRRALQFEAIVAGLAALTNQVAVLKARDEELQKKRPSDELKKRQLEAERFQLGQLLQKTEIDRAAAAAMIELLQVLNESGAIQLELTLQIEEGITVVLARTT